MGFEEEVKAIPQDLEGLVKGDVKLGKFHVPKAAIAAVIVGTVAVFAYVNRNKVGGSSAGSANGDVGNGTFGTSEGNSSTVSGGGVGSTDSGTIPADTSNSNPTPSIPPIFDIPSNNGGSDSGSGGFNLPSLPDFNNGGFSLPSLGSDNGYSNQVPYMGYGDGNNYAIPMNGGNTGIVSPINVGSNPVTKVTNPLRGALGKVAKGIGSPVGFAGSAASKPQVQSGSGLGVANLLKGSAYSVKSPNSTTVIKSVSGVGGASSFGGVKPVVSFNNIQQLKPIVKNTAKPFQNVASLFTNFFKPIPPQPTHYQVSTPVYRPPVYFNYHPAPIPKVNNGVNYFKNLSTHVGNGGV